MTTYKGFSTVGKRFGNFVYEDKEIAKRDLINHFYTRKGERLGNPEFGSILPSLVFEPLTDDVVTEVEDDVRDVITTDPRWRLENLNVEVGEHSITCFVDLTYLTDGSPEQLYLNYTTE